MTSNSQPAEVELTVSLAKELIAEQHTDLAHLPISFLAEGWDNGQFRLGEELIVRLPRRQLADQLIRNEQQCLPVIQGLVTLPIPVPVRIGVPSDRFGWSWSVVPWVDGTDALTARPAPNPMLGDQLVHFLRALHVPADADAPENPFRGIPLVERDERVRPALEAASGAATYDLAAAVEVWDDALAAAPYDGPPVWLHGDLHPGNVLVNNDRVVSVIDWGDVTAGDPATDLGALWMLLDLTHRSHAVAALGLDEPAVRRARGWALGFGAVLLVNSDDRPDYRSLALRVIGEVLGDSGTVRSDF